MLQQAVSALEGSGDELTYNYALFNLGQALNRAGRPDEAIPILEQRLEYPDQTDEVQAELDSAYENAGISQDGGRGPGNGNGNAFGKEKEGRGLTPGA